MKYVQQLRNNPFTLERASDTDIAYAAGLLDGEGCIQIVHRVGSKTDPRFHSYGIRVAVGMSDEAPIRWLAETFGGPVSFLQPKRPGARVVWKWYVCSRNAADFLIAVRPYLRLKDPAVQIALDMQATMLPRSRGSRKQITEELAARRRELWLRLKAFNKREVAA